MTPSASQHWQLRLVEGGLAVAVAIAIVAARPTTEPNLTLALGLGQLVAGACEMAALAAAPRDAHGRLLLFVTALVNTATGAYVLGANDSSGDDIRIAMGVWWLTVALEDVATAREDRPRVAHRAAAVASAAVGAALLALADVGLSTLATLLAGALAARGAHELALAAYLRGPSAVRDDARRPVR